MNPVEVLKKAREIIAKEENWAQHVFAANEKGESVPDYSSDACKFCSLGAISKAVGSDDEYHITNFVTYTNAKRLLMSAIDEHIAVFNDTHTHEEVIAAFDKAIEIGEHREYV